MPTPPRKIAILDCGELQDLEMADYNSISQMVLAWIEPMMPQVHFEAIPIAYGAPFPDVDAFDGYILPGSASGVYDDTPWMKPLADFLLQLREAKRPIFGICFGHQMMAQTFGGHARKLDLGLITGTRRFTTAQGEIDVNVMHQDQVVEIPVGARIIAASDYCPIGALEYSFPAQSIQFHPEYPPDFMITIVDRLDGELFDKGAANLARKFIAAELPRDIYKTSVVKFFTEKFSTTVETA